MFPVNNTQKDSSYCSVPLCSNYVGEYSLSFHYFPIDNKSREGWQAALNLDAPCTRYMRICSEHFKKSDFLPGKKLKKRLKKNVIPSLKLPVGHYVEQLLSKNQSLKSDNIKLENGEKDRNKNDMGNVHDETTYVTKIKSEICEANYHKTDGNQHENICEKTDATSELPYEFGSPSGIILLQEKINDEVSMEEKSIFYNTNDESIYENDPLLKHDDLISLRPEENHGLFIENSRIFYQRNMKSTYVNTSCDIIKSELNETNDYKKSELSHPEKISTKTEIDDQSPNQYKLEINEELIIKEEPDLYYVDEDITGNISTNKNGVEHEIPEGNHYTPENNLDTYSERHLAPVLCNETQTSLMEYKSYCLCQFVPIIFSKITHNKRMRVDFQIFGDKIPYF